MSVPFVRHTLRDGTELTIALRGGNLHAEVDGTLIDECQLTKLEWLIEKDRGQFTRLIEDIQTNSGHVILMSDTHAILLTEEDLSAIEDAQFRDPYYLRMQRIELVQAIAQIADEACNDYLVRLDAADSGVISPSDVDWDLREDVAGEALAAFDALHPEIAAAIQRERSTKTPLAILS